MFENENSFGDPISTQVSFSHLHLKKSKASSYVKKILALVFNTVTFKKGIRSSQSVFTRFSYCLNEDLGLGVWFSLSIGCAYYFFLGLQLVHLQQEGSFNCAYGSYYLSSR